MIQPELYNLVIYGIVLIIMLILMTGIFLRIKYRFFYVMRDFYILFQYHRLWYAPYKPIKDLEINTKYYDPYTIIQYSNSSNVSYKEIPESIYKTIVDFYEKYYIHQNLKDTYTINLSIEDIKTILSPASIVGTYNIDSSIKNIMVMIPIWVYEKRQNKKEIMYYIDHSITRNEDRNKGYAVTTYYTMIIDRMKHNIDTSFIFKTEGVGLPILPIVTYNAVVVSISNSIIPNTHIQPLELIEVKKSNLSIFRACMNQYINRRCIFSIFLPFEDSCKQIELGIYHIYILKHKEDVFAIYFFKDLRFHYKTKKSIECIGSINYAIPKHSEPLFIDAFLRCLHNLKEIYMYEYVMIELLNENITLYRDGVLRLKIEYFIPCKYYFINYIQKTYQPKDCFIMP